MLLDLSEGIDDAYLGVVKRRRYDDYQGSNE